MVPLLRGSKVHQGGWLMIRSFRWPRWREVAALLAGLVLAVLAGEVFCALAMPSTRVTRDLLGHSPIVLTGGCWQEAEAQGHLLREPRPSCRGRHRLLDDYDVEYRFNAHGLRGPEVVPAAEPRILVLGDSQTFGQGVAEPATFCALLGDRLAVPADRPTAVMNAGVPGYGTFEEAWRAERLVPLLRPRFVVVTVFADNVLIPDEGNDLSNNLAWIRATTATPSEPGAATRVSRPRAAWPWLADHSHLYAALAAAKRRLRGEPDHYEAVRRTLAAPPAIELGEAWARTREALRGIAEMAHRHGVERTFVLYLPGIGSLEASDRSVVGELEKTGLPVVSAFDRLAAAGDPRALTHRHDGHYDARAHALVAESLAEALLPYVGSPWPRTAP